MQLGDMPTWETAGDLAPPVEVDRAVKQAEGGFFGSEPPQASKDTFLKSGRV